MYPYATSTGIHVSVYGQNFFFCLSLLEWLIIIKVTILLRISYNNAACINDSNFTEMSILKSKSAEYDSIPTHLNMNLWSRKLVLTQFVSLIIAYKTYGEIKSKYDLKLKLRT